MNMNQYFKLKQQITRRNSDPRSSTYMKKNLLNKIQSYVKLNSFDDFKYHSRGVKCHA